MESSVYNGNVLNKRDSLFTDCDRLEGSVQPCTYIHHVAPLPTSCEGMRELILAVRADEACHSHVNHTFSEMKPEENNPFVEVDSGNIKH